MLYVDKKLSLTANQLLKASRKKICELDTLMLETGYKTDNVIPKDGYIASYPLSGADKHYWIKSSVTVPEKEEGVHYALKFTTGVDDGWDGLNPQGIVYLNGVAEQGLDTHHNEVRIESGREYAVDTYFYTSDVETPFEVKIELIKVYEQIEGLYYDIVVPLEALEFLNPNTTDYITILNALECCDNIIDNRCLYNRNYFASIDKAREYMKTEFYEKCCSVKDKPIVNYIFHTHIDVEWRWDRAVTKEKIQRSFTTAEHLMKFYPEYRFMLSQPELYRYLKAEYPEKYESLKQLVKDGRWEPEGAMFVEPDCNLVCGESFFRQIIHGTKFFRDEFGIECKTLFLPDVFGYSASLPQILKKCNIDYFITSKISWNDVNTIPYDSFMWQGIDGTEIYTSFICGRRASKEHATDRIASYVLSINASTVMGTVDRYQQKELGKNVLATVGWGDGGGGPEQADIEKYRRLKLGLPGLPVAKINGLIPYIEESKREFDEGCARLKRTPKWVGELYLELHRGTYTSIAKNKRNNRKAEFGMQRAEALSVLDMLAGGEYDSEGFDANWKKILHNQFHDILPGSSIKKVYDGTDIDYAEIAEFYNSTADKKLKTIANNINTDKKYVVYNSLGFAQSGTIVINGETVEINETVPAYGYTAIDEPNFKCGVAINGLTAENDFYILRLNECGQIVYLFDKENNRIVTTDSPMNCLVAYEDLPYYHDAWDIASYYVNKSYPLNAQAEITEICDGTRRGFRVRHIYCDSEVTQNIWLYSASHRIDLDTTADWHNKHQLLRVNFPVNIKPNDAVYEIQFGHVHRPNHKNTSWDEAKFEVCAHKWADISEYGYGFALLNDCKYGHSCNGNVLSLTLIKCASWPNPEADDGIHNFTYSIFPHSGDFRAAGVINEGYMLNRPLSVMPVGGKGALPESYSFISCDCDNIFIETVKKAENGNGIIVRAYDAFDTKCNAVLHLDSRIKRAFICDGLENEATELPIQDNTLSLSFGNFEIHTIKLVL